MHPTEELEEMAEMCDDNVFLLLMGLYHTALLPAASTGSQPFSHDL